MKDSITLDGARQKATAALVPPANGLGPDPDGSVVAPRGFECANTKRPRRSPRLNSPTHPPAAGSVSDRAKPSAPWPAEAQAVYNPAGGGGTEMRCIECDAARCLNVPSGRPRVTDAFAAVPAVSNSMSAAAAF